MKGADVALREKQENEDETRDVPFLRNDMKDHAPTTGKDQNESDVPGKADSELAESDEPLPGY